MTASTLAQPPRSPARRDERLDAIRAKVDRGERLTLDDGILLYETKDLWSVLAMADAVRRRLHGSAAYYNINRHFNYSNVCALSCKFCEFFAKAQDQKAYTRTHDDARAEARRAVESGATEMHMVGGLHPTLPFSYYTDLCASVRDEARALGSDLHVKAFTAVEIVHLARIAKQYRGASAPGEEGREARREGIRWVLSRLRDAGLGSLPGGGAEVFDDRVHDEAYKGKIRSDVWLDVHRVAHELGLNTNATMLYGHIEQRHDRLVHLDMLRRAQDEALARMGYAGVAHAGPVPREQPPGHPSGHLGYTGNEGGDTPIITLTRAGVPLPEHVAFGTDPAPHDPRTAPPSSDPRPGARAPGYYQTIIPLPFFPDGCELEHLPGPGGLENYRTLAIARLMLDNVPHVKSFWIMQTLPMAQIMLQAGADDIDGTVVWYDITHVGGSGTHQEVSVRTLQRTIRDAGFEPVERDTLYRRVVRDESDGRRWRAVPMPRRVQ
jgi:aminodeoxyfutalosine synthase